MHLEECVSLCFHGDSRDRILASWSLGGQLAGFGTGSKLPYYCVFHANTSVRDRDLIVCCG